MSEFRHATKRLLTLTILAGAISTANALPIQDTQTAPAFANPELLLSTSWLAKHAGDEGVTIVDVRAANNFKDGHIPGAVNIATSATFDPKSRGNIGPAQQIAAVLGQHGITASTHVVLYDSGRATGAARVLWTLEVYGHAKVSVVDGGFAKWKHEERKVTADSTALTAVEYKIGKQTDRRSDMDQVLDDVDNPEVIMLDSRSTREFSSGHIPAAVHIEWLDNFTSDDVPVYKSPKELIKLYADQGVTTDKLVHGY